MKNNQIKVKKPLYKRWWFTVVVVIVIFGVIGSNGDNDSKETSSTGTENVQDPQDIENEEPTTISKEYKDGKYLVGTDIEVGLYKVTLTDTIMNMGYIERAKDLKMELDSILANIILTGDGYVEILPTDVAVKLQGVTIEKISLEDLEPDFKTEVEGGIYLIGYDLQPGTYKVDVTDTIMEMGYVERLSSVAMNMSDIIASEIIQGQSYIEILESDFAVRIQGAKLTLQN